MQHWKAPHITEIEAETVEDAKEMMRAAATKPDPTVALLAERGGTHGSFIDNARLSQGFKRIMRSSPNWDLLSDTEKEAWELRATKWSRYFSGDMGSTKFGDNLDDDQGYLRLTEEPR